MLSRVDPAQRTPQALCLCPTRELVVQNVMVTQKMGRHTGVQVESTADESVMPRRWDQQACTSVSAAHLCNDSDQHDVFIEWLVPCSSQRPACHQLTPSFRPGHAQRKHCMLLLPGVNHQRWQRSGWLVAPC